MALRTAIANRLRLTAIANIAHSPSSQKPLTAAVPCFHHHLPENSSSTAHSGFFTRLYHRRQSPRLFYLPVRKKLTENSNISDCVRNKPDALKPLATENAPSASDSVHNVRKMMRCWQLQNVRLALNLIPTDSITYSKFITICSQVCDNRDEGVEVAKMLDVAGDVLVFKNVVFLRPDQVAKSMERIITQTMTIPNDPRKPEFEQLQRQKSLIDQKAISHVRFELYCGLGFITLQTLGFMRLTFWELSWDVMEPICFFFTSFHFALAYMFFLRTSTQPSFAGFFRQRFKVKRSKLMAVRNFDYERFKELRDVFYPNYTSNRSRMSTV